MILDTIQVLAKNWTFYFTDDICICSNVQWWYWHRKGV